MGTTDLAPDDGPLLSERYRLVSRIGEGGMAGVYRAYDERLRVWRAAKVLFPDYARKKKVRRRFEREAHTMARLEHPNLVRVVDVGHSGKLPYIVMELVGCGTLMQWVEVHGPMPERLAVDAMLQVCEAVKEVHRNGVVHRDIKPHNVLINEQGVCKLTDFGIAQDTEEELTRAGSVMGTMGYMAPEQRNDAGNVDGRADIYSIAATLWKLITKRKARDLFMYEEDARILEGIDETLAEVLKACFAYAREDRPDDIDQVIEALKAVRDLLPEPPATTPELPVRGAMTKAEEATGTFDEIAPAFTLSDTGYDTGYTTGHDEPEDKPSSSPSSMLVGGLGSPGLGPPKPTYTMSRPVESDRAEGERPSWLAEEELAETPAPVGRSGFVIGANFGDDFSQEMDEAHTVLYRDEASVEDVPALLDDPVADEPTAKRPAPDKSSKKEGATEPGSPLPSDADDDADGHTFSGMSPVGKAAAVLGPLVGVIAAGAILLVALIVGVIGYGTVSVRSLEEAAEVSERNYYVVLDKERPVVGEIVKLDRSAATLEGLYLDYLDQTQDPAARREAAARFIDELVHYSDQLGNEHGSVNVKSRTARLKAARRTFETDQQAFEAGAGGFPGVIAVSIGLAPSP